MHNMTCQDLAFLIDETFGKMSPLDSMLKMEGIMRTCKSNTLSQQWVMITMADLCLNRVMVPQELTPNSSLVSQTKKGSLDGFCEHEFRNVSDCQGQCQYEISMTVVLRMAHVWLWKLANKPKLPALLDQRLSTEDAMKIRTNADLARIN